MRLSRGRDGTPLRANLIVPGRGCSGGWGEPSGRLAVFTAGREPGAGGAHGSLLCACPPLAQPLVPLRPPGRGAPVSPVASRTRAREPGRGRAGAAGLAPEVGVEREAGRRGGRADGLRVEVGRGRPGLGAWVPGARAPAPIPVSSYHPPLGELPAPLSARGLLTPLALCRLCTCPLGPVLPFALQTGPPPSLTFSGSSTKLDSLLQPHSSLFVVCTLVISTLFICSITPSATIFI